MATCDRSLCARDFTLFLKHYNSPRGNAEILSCELSAAHTASVVECNFNFAENTCRPWESSAPHVNGSHATNCRIIAALSEFK